MTKDQIDAIFDRALRWPLHLQVEAACILEEMEANGGALTAEHRAMVAGRGEPSDEEVEAFLRRPIPE